MPTIAEEMEDDSGFAFCDLPASASGPADALAHLTTAEFAPEYCSIHPDEPNYFTNGFMGDWALPEPEVPAPSGLEEPDYSRFEDWIPKFVRPVKPCDYCRSRRLMCYVQRGEPQCTPCATLFRECSLSKSTTLEANNYATNATGTFLDTLHLIDENAAHEHGNLTGIKPLKSKPSGSIPVRADDAPGSSKRNGIRFPRHAVKILRDWIEAHADNPYPTEEEKADLERQTELSPSQVANWLANARRRRKITERSRPKLCESPSLRPTTSAIPIPGADKPWEELNPFERWQHSPPENEPADLDDIAYAVATNALPPDESRSDSPSTLGRSSKRRKASSSGSGWSHRRAPSTGSAETGQTSSLSASTSAAHSNNSSHSTHGSFGSFSSSLAGKKDRRRRRKPVAKTPASKLGETQKRIFQCTFCTDTFRAKYDWTRHEKSLHLSLEKWICAPLGPVITDQESGDKRCVYCDLHNPSSDHIESHNHRQCEDKGLDARTFYRKDHLRQHLRLMHGCEMSPSMDSWKSTAVNINSRCGFCSQRFSVWQERVDHLTAHFKAGARMSEWKGCRGLDPAVAAQVTNAMPPYLIGMEAISPNPFSASNRGTWRDPAEFGATADNAEARETYPMPAGDDGNGASKSTCWEDLAVRLGKFAKEMSDKGIVITDDMLQKRAREVLYDSDDPWNQTAADNPEWLDLFKKAHGLNFIPTQIGGQGSQVPEDLETFSDLGLRVPFALQLNAYNQCQLGAHRVDSGTRPGPYQQAKSQLRELYEILSTECAIHDGDQRCEHAACANNVIDVSPVIQMSGGNATGPWTRRWCSEKISPKAAQKLAQIRSSTDSRSNAASSNRAKALQNLWSLEAVQHEHTESCGQPSENRSRGLETLRNLEMRNHDHSQKCSACFSGATSTTDSNRANGLATLTQQENVACFCKPINQDLVASRSRARALETLATMHGPDSCSHSKLPATRTYLPRHKLVLPQDKARLFATTTGAWEDSGSMPTALPTTTTSLPNIEESAGASSKTSTGAMMEFLGGDVGADLPFSTDTQTSEIQLPNFDFNDMALPQVTQDELLSQLNELLDTTTTTTTSAPVEQTMPDFDAMGMDWTTADAQMTSTGEMNATLPADENADFDFNTHMNMNMMNDVNLEGGDLGDLDFDGVFDMPLDETFHPPTTK